MADRRVLGMVLLAVAIPVIGFVAARLVPPPAGDTPPTAIGDPPRFKEAQAHHQKDELEAARAIYQELAPKHLGSRCYEAVLASRLDPGAATASVALQLALAKDPSDRHCLTLFGRELIYAGKPKDALPYLERAVGAAPNDAFAHASVGFAHFSLFDYRTAAQDFARALELDPERAMYAYNAGYSHFQYGDYAGARPHLERAMALGLDADVKRAAQDQLDMISGATWVCPMHPEERGKKGEKCPRCGMALEPVSAGIPSE